MAAKYEEAGLKSADAAILADATMRQVEFFLSWNREDIVNPHTVKKIREINEGKRKTPLLMKPSDFLDRVSFSVKTGKGLQALMFSARPVPRRSRVQFFP